MAAPISPMQLLVSIVERGKGRCLLDHYRQFGLIHHNQAAGHGTAASHLLDTLGFGTSERDVVLTLGPRDTIRQLMNHLKDDDRSKLGAPGIAFALDLSGMSAILAVTLARLEEMGLVVRTVSDQCRREKQAALTPAGEQTASQIRQVLQNWGQIRYQGFSPEERAQYESFLIRICENVQQYKQGGITIG